jgi:hypothetical protein
MGFLAFLDKRLYRCMVQSEREQFKQAGKESFKGPWQRRGQDEAARTQKQEPKLKPNGDMLQLTTWLCRCMQAGLFFFNC